MPAPEPPYHAVIITAHLTDDLDGYAEMNARMAELGSAQPGFLGRTSMTDSDGRETTILYYQDDRAIRDWKAHPEHVVAQRLGRERWYAAYEIEVCRVERRYGFTRAPHRPVPAPPPG
jgi:heme-degrading monooxygenase HmoA